MLTGRERGHHGDILRAVAGLAEAGAVRPVLDPRHFGLCDAAEAQAAIEKSTADGKVVIDVQG
jgi:NADPH:quinone reductase